MEYAACCFKDASIIEKRIYASLRERRGSRSIAGNAAHTDLKSVLEILTEKDN